MTEELSDTDIEHFRQRLIDERESLQQQAESGAEDRAPVTLDQQSVGRLSRMDAMQMQAMALASEERRQARLRRIAAALDRIDKDEYGVCAACDEPIPKKRLEFDPTLPRCVDCAAEAG